MKQVLRAYIFCGACGNNRTNRGGFQFAAARLPWFMAWKQQDAVRSRFKAAKDAFEALNVIAFDKHWVGSTATVAKVSNMITPPERLDKPWAVQVLAVTKGGTWFAVDLQVTGTDKVQMLSLHQLSEKAAKTMLAFDLEVYEKFFGKPDVA
ncbi:hypothetical protein M1V57_25635 [Escherichia coli]|uniref:hypothetical protein n=1 Tax=Escherichia coli TaxID=562 RepID=UPI0020912925|nr:hypothetical protein [Escherichia coli]MCO5014486.1 hypothetical protein [Escherichia coli]